MKTLIAGVLFFALSLPSFAQTQINKFQRSELKNTLLSYSSDNFREKKLNAQDTKKSALLGALFSAVIPGAGELYAKSYVKAAIFAVVEAGLWFTYASFQKKGNNKTDEFKSYADGNWDVYRYARWIKEAGFDANNEVDLNADRETLRYQLNGVERANFSHTLPQYGTQQYYELIGKYQNFIAGWSTSDQDYLRQNRENYKDYRHDQVNNYMIDRQKANDYYDNASLTLTGVVVNHALSAADAAWTVSMFNKNIRIKSSLRLEPTYLRTAEQTKLVPTANFNITF